MGSSVPYYAGCEDHPYQSHFLEACFLCRKPLGQNSDIYMYRGNTPFCSQECRQEQIEIDESKEKSWKFSKQAVLRQTTEPAKKDGPNKSSRTGTLVVA